MAIEKRLAEYSELAQRARTTLLAAPQRNYADEPFPYDDARMPDVQPVTVTDEMRVAGLSCVMSDKTDGDWVEEMYRAMHAAAPVPLVSEAEGRLQAMLVLCGEPECRDVDGYPEKLRALIDGLIDLRNERNSWRNAAETLSVAYDDVVDKVINRNAEVARLYDALKLRTDEKEAMQSMIDMLLRAAHRPAPAATPKPARNPFREHATDRRRMGP